MVQLLLSNYYSCSVFALDSLEENKKTFEESEMRVKAGTHLRPAALQKAVMVLSEASSGRPSSKKVRPEVEKNVNTQGFCQTGAKYAIVSF